MGYTRWARPGIFAYLAAPVQVSWLGSAGTMGAPFIDYLIADGVVIPAGAESFYSESVVRLPHCYLPNDDGRPIAVAPTREEAGLPASGAVLCAFTNAYKITPRVFAVWMRLLRETPGSVLWLRGMGEVARENLSREAERSGVERSRLVFAPHVAGMAEHLARQGLADLYLDTQPYNAHSTACDALWAGVPVLTCVGRSFASRVAASALTAVGLPELITPTLEEFEGKALELLREPPKLRGLREKLARQRLTSPLFDTRGFTRDLESAYLAMHERTARGEPPAERDPAARLASEADAWHRRGLLALQNGELEQGIELIERSLT
jgi:protein O-GlcNAc transferase